MAASPSAAASTPTAGSTPRQEALFAAPDGPKFVRRGDLAGASVGREQVWWWWAAGLAVLLVALIMADRWPTLARDPDWRPHMQALCDRLGCSVPAWRQPEALRVTGRQFRRHPSVADALLLTAGFRNDAAFAQPWPNLRVELTDIDGAVLGVRVFSVEEYLGRVPESAQIAPGQDARLVLELLDPGERAEAFRIDFR